MNARSLIENPLLPRWATPDEVPPFAAVKPEHFAPAYDRAFAEHEAEVAAIAAAAEPPDFDNTIAALERSGRALERVDARLPSPGRRPQQRGAAGDRTRDCAADARATGTRSTPTLTCSAASTRSCSRPTRSASTPNKSACSSAITSTFRRAGAALDGAAKQRLAEIIERLAALGTAFSQNVLADEQAFALSLDRRGGACRPARFHARSDEIGGAGARPRRPRCHAVALQR